MGISEDEIKSIIRSVPDFPKKGIMFRDITPLLRDAAIFRRIIQELADRFKGVRIDGILGIEARGFIIASALAHMLQIPFIPARKLGKLPWKTVKETYTLEYGQDGLEIHADAIRKGENILIIDDLLATGGTAAAAARLVEKVGGSIAGIGFIVELSYLKGQDKIKEYRTISLSRYDSE
jgi:adenine phosphoribosyltransferase